MLRLLVVGLPFIVSAVILYDVRHYVRWPIAIGIFLLCSFVFPFGPIIYLLNRHKIVKKQLMQTSFCPKCGKNVAVFHKKCPSCGNIMTL